MKLLFLAISILVFLTAEGQILQIPSRPPAALSGSQVISVLTPLSLTAREDSIFSQVVQGNVPDFMRTLVLVTDTEIISSSPVVVAYYVMPDYLALGCDTDYFLCPMTPLLAQRIANYTGTSMPTRKMVNQIWQQAPCKLAPQTITPSPQMTTVPVFADHNSMVWTSRSNQLATHPLGTLTGGDKKDVVISNIIYGYPAPGRVVIYGWHYLSGTPIQPLYNGHEETYADYSHGIRLVQNNIMVNGSTTTIQNVLASSSLNVLLSDEGVIAVPYYPYSAPALTKPVSFCAINDNAGNIRVKVKADPLVAGYNVMISRNGTVFEMPVYYSGSDFSITGLVSDTLYYLKISAQGISGGSSPYSELLAATTNTIAGSMVWPFIIVNGFDRPTAGNTFDFIRQHASAVFSFYNPWIYGFAISSATNEALCDSLILTDDYTCMDYILGEESSANETFSNEEQMIIAAYLDSGKPLFVSGSEIGWDLDHLGSVSDKDFYHNYLQAIYVEDAPNNQASMYYNFTIEQNGQSYNFDNGTQGTYDVRYPDVVDVVSYPGALPVGYYTSFPSKYAGVCLFSRLVYLAVPFETIYPESARQELFDWVAGVLFIFENADSRQSDEIKVFPNPSAGKITIQTAGLCNEKSFFRIADMMGQDVPYKITESGAGKWEMEIQKPGTFVLSLICNHIKYTAKVVVLR